MTTVTFTIPHAQIPAVASALVAIYGDVARDLGPTVTGSEPRLAAVEALRSENLLDEIQTRSHAASASRNLSERSAGNGPVLLRP